MSLSQTEMKSTSPTPSAGSSPADVDNKAATKLCHIVKRPDFDGYGFNLHSEKAKPGQFIGKVDANSPAEAAGLKEGDRIIEVNGLAINNETHKQVVQRIKAISCEVRLLLVDVDGKGDGSMVHNNNDRPSNGQAMESSKNEQVLPGASENIKSITMVSTKRPSQESQRNSGQSNNNNNNNNYGIDATDKSVSANDQHQTMMTPPPPSATMMASPKKSLMNNNNSIGSNHSPVATSNGSPLAEMAAGSGSASGNGNATIKAGSLQLPMTAAEMRAKLMMKKKYDPKNEMVDLKKKYEIVQKL